MLNTQSKPQDIRVIVNIICLPASLKTVGGNERYNKSSWKEENGEARAWVGRFFIILNVILGSDQVNILPL